MPPGHFRTIFDAANEGYSTWWFPAFGLIFVCAGRTAGIQTRARAETDAFRRLKGRARTAFSWYFFNFAVVWTLGSFATTYAQYQSEAKALHGGSHNVVEGPIKSFAPMPYAGHSEESFVVADRRFSYSDYLVTPGFHNTSSHGGPIEDGLYVRVTYIGNLIVRLEIAQ